MVFRPFLLFFFLTLFTPHSARPSPLVQTLRQIKPPELAEPGKLRKRLPNATHEELEKASETIEVLIQDLGLRVGSSADLSGIESDRALKEAEELGTAIAAAALLRVELDRPTTD